MKNVCIKKGIVLIIILLALFCVYSPSTGFKQDVKLLVFNDGNILYVGGIGEGNYTKIQDAIDNASDGDTVFVYNGTYDEEHIGITNKSINLVGENKNTTVIMNTSVWVFSSKNVIIHSFTIAKEGYPGDINIHFLNCSNCIFYDNIAQSTGYSFRCILIMDSSEIKVSKNYITSGSVSISIDNSQNCIIQNNYVIGNKNYLPDTGIWITGSTNVTVFLNQVSSYPFGIGIWSSKNVDVIQNNLIRNIKNADFRSKNLYKVSWDGNYWGRPRLLPHPIRGWFFIIPIIQFDWHPAKEPYDI
ncbi:MAG: hypothetical protein A3K77_02250 [Euryarchaeota archaeon RBG_13_31_8]|nr:MAG: hypothetical protein A3K77_02250 [Euryarchaeota archaeon RBG_13_31_8]